MDWENEQLLNFWTRWWTDFISVKKKEREEKKAESRSRTEPENADAPNPKKPKLEESPHRSEENPPPSKRFKRE